MKYVLTILALVLSVCIAEAQVVSPYYEDAVKAMDNKEWDRALRLLNKGKADSHSKSETARYDKLIKECRKHIITPPKPPIAPPKPSSNTYVERTETLKPGEHYDFVGKFGSAGLALVKLRGKYGFIDTLGHEIIPLKFDTIGIRVPDEDVVWESRLDLMSVSQNGNWGYVKTDGNVSIPLKYSDGPYTIKPEDHAVVSIHRPNDSNNFGVIAYDGTVTVPFEYAHIDKFRNNLPSMAYKIDYYKGYPHYTFGFIDYNNNIIIPFKYGSAFGWGGNPLLAPVSIDGKFGYIDIQGKEVIPLQYEYADKFYNGLAAVVSNHKVGFIDSTGNVVIPFEYDVPYYMHDYPVLELKYWCHMDFWTYCKPLKKNGKYGAINKKGETIVPFIYDHMGRCVIDRSFDLEKDGKTYYFDIGGNQYMSDAGRTDSMVLRLGRQGFAECQYYLGNRYKSGTCGMPKNLDSAIHYFELSARNGYVDAMIAIGGLFSVERNNPKSEYNPLVAFYIALSWYESACNSGHGSACVDCAWMYYLGIKKDLTFDKKFGYDPNKDNPKNLDLAERYFNKAIALNYFSAYYGLGAVYHDIGNYDAAMQSFRKCLDMSSSKLHIGLSYKWLGHMYHYGHGVEKDLLEAARLYKLAIKYGADAEKELEKIRKGQ